MNSSRPISSTNNNNQMEISQDDEEILVADKHSSEAKIITKSLFVEIEEGENSSILSFKYNKKNHSFRAEYEKKLRKIFQDNSLKVYHAKNGENEKGILIESKKLYNYFSLHNTDESYQLNQRNNKSSETIFGIYIAEKNIEKLTELEIINLNPINVEQTQSENIEIWPDDLQGKPKLHQLKQAIQSIPQDENFKDIRNAFRSYFDLACTNEGNDTITEHLTELAKEVGAKAKKGQTLTLEEIENSKIKLEEKLQDNPPSMTMKSILYGLIGGLIGLVAGAIICAAATWYLGGVGAIAGMFIGAFTGYTMATTVLVSTVGTGIIFGSVHGLFKGHEQQTVSYPDAKKEKDDSLNRLKSPSSAFVRGTLFNTNKPVDKIYDALTTKAKSSLRT